tara:strand:+ start:509 stop:919 length:411 start_codon:yes stop_codon:yes gene_type:complete
MIGKIIAALVAALMLATGYAQAADTKVKVSARDCRKLVQHQARSNVNYKPGVDVRGRKVVGADLDGGHKLKLPSTVEFNIGFNPLKGAAATRFGDTSASVGKVKYDISKNTFTFNGQPMNDKAMADMARKCRSAGR